MKKKILLSVIVLVVALVCLSACSKYESAVQDIAQLLQVNYSQVELRIETTKSSTTLTGVYNLTIEEDRTTVEYTVEKLNEIDMNGGAGGFKTTETGRVVVQDGKIVEGSTEVELPDALYFGGISFKPSYFKKMSVSASKFEADVTNPQKFIGNNELKCSNMHVIVRHKQTVLTQLAITYVAENGSDVSILYIFTK